MTKALKILLIVVAIGIVTWLAIGKISFTPKTTITSNHQLLVEHIEAMGKLELVKYRISDVLEHKNLTTFLPEASVLLIIKADAVGCIDLTKLNPEDIETKGDSVSIKLPQPEICYIKIDHSASRVYDTKMAFFREAQLVDEAYKYAEKEIQKEVLKSDILQQTKSNALRVLRPFLQGLGYTKIHLRFE